MYHRVFILSIVNMVLISVGEGLDRKKMDGGSYRRYGVGGHMPMGASPRYEPLMRKDVYKRLQGLDDRLIWLLISHRNVSATVQRTDHRIHRINHRLNSIRETESIRESKLEQLSEKISRQNKEISKLRYDNAKLKQTLDRLSHIVDRLNVGKSGDSVVTTASPAVNSLPEVEPTKPRLPKDCRDVFIQSTSQSPGNYYVMIQPSASPIPFQVCCQITNTTGWTVIQRRVDGSVDFYRTWDEYKRGFGNLETEFWLGNDRIHQITSQGDYKLRIELETWDGNRYFAEYDSFSITDEADKYRLRISGYKGNAGDSLTSYWENHDQQQFSTKDSDHDNRFFDNCAEQYKGAWWFKSCFESHLNGLYKHQGGHDNYFQRDGIQWNTIHLHSSLKYTAMMVKPVDRKGSRK
ncbi:fibrinogen-like protein 1 [Tubulanus polymorphus]|uniref:fibrinogen-like protein 1 n=1 Tax=Tubulanus polymorphus TaxID=672921 RepID=UPI003DA486A4